MLGHSNKAVIPKSATVTARTYQSANNLAGELTIHGAERKASIMLMFKEKATS